MVRPTDPARRLQHVEVRKAEVHRRQDRQHRERKEDDEERARNKYMTLFSHSSKAPRCVLECRLPVRERMTSPT